MIVVLQCRLLFIGEFDPKIEVLNLWSSSIFYSEFSLTCLSKNRWGAAGLEYSTLNLPTYLQLQKEKHLEMRNSCWREQ